MNAATIEVLVGVGQRDELPVELQACRVPLDEEAVPMVLFWVMSLAGEPPRSRPRFPERPSSRTRAPSRRPERDDGRPLTVLVCDDEPRLAVLTAGLLEQFGYGSLTVSTGSEVIEVLCRGIPPCDLILLDLNLADGGAREVMEQMRAAGYHRPVILTSGYAQEDVPPELLSDPLVAGYLAKPYTVESLVGVVGEALDRRR